MLAVLAIGCAPAAVPLPTVSAMLASPVYTGIVRRPPAEAADLTPMVYLPGVFHNAYPNYINPFGVVMYEGVTDALGLGHMETAGSRWVTTTFIWAAVEPSAPVSGTHTYNWQSFDTAAANAQAAGADVFALFTYNPAWAAEYPGGPVTNTTHLIDIVTEVAERYDGDGVADAAGSPVVNYWSFYAEPDNNQAWRSTAQLKGLWGDNPEGYAAMLAQVAPAMRAANPNVKVLMGGLAYDWFTTDHLEPGPPDPGPFVRAFLGEVLDALNANHPGGVTAYLDGITFHYYPIDVARWANLREKTLEIKGIADAHGASELPLLVPEMGFWSDASAQSSEHIQAQRLVQMYVHGLSVGIQQMSWYSIFDFGNGTNAVGLFRGQDLMSPKPAYSAFTTLTTELTGARYQQALAIPGVEGYVFRMPNGQTKTVAWASGGSVNLTFAQACARRVQLLGSVTQVADGGAGDADGTVNGLVTLALTLNEPLYVSVCN
jgi:hypothetical protein